ncbi:MAG: tRNA (N(6)-L-threonylcarbamoyladenosine(37)-C(2))-methylthiotransferase MtaB [Spirochaetaceae bacterium]|nr:MAG: tRNA (N(6)-L-threonylcarbamoyladenosine(37)-C(2))-methylthiotransferase MtaB [Spirochaetaceae bacterium]
MQPHHVAPQNRALRPHDDRRVAFQTLGCRLNQFETDSLAGAFESAGYTVVPFEEPAEAYIVNTCTVTNKADRKSRNTINRAMRHKRGVVVVTGCFVESHRRQLETHPGTFVVDNARKRHVVELVDAHLRGEILHPQSLDVDLFGYPVTAPIFRTRSMVKIQDGCDNFCTFCIIPFVRGRARSRDPRSILEHARRALDKGYREIVITGVNVSRYDHGQTGFSALVEQMLELEGSYRLRISSMEPDSLDDRFYDLLNHPRMCPQLHLCLQSGSDSVLQQMRRQYSVAQYRAILERIRARRPDFNITTDVLVGFPGESEADFESTCALCNEIGFGHIHTFAYSRRSGTRADRMSAQIPEVVKQLRSERIRAIAADSKRRYRRGFVGRTQQLLVEQIDPRSGLARGYGEHYLPLITDAAGLERNSLVTVVLRDLDDGDDPLLRATVLKSVSAGGTQKPVT